MDIDVVCFSTRFNVIPLMFKDFRYNKNDNFTFYHIQVFFLINLEDNHWIIVRVDLRHKKVWVNDSMIEDRNDKTYCRLFKLFEVIFP